MSSYNQTIEDELLLHSTRVERAKEQQIRDIQKILNEKNESIREEIVLVYVDASRRDISLLMKRIDKINDEYYSRVLKVLGNDAEKFARDEAKTVYSIFTNAMPESIKQSIKFLKAKEKVNFVSAKQDYNNEIIVDRTLEEWVDSLSFADGNRVKASIRSGYENEDSLDDLIRVIFGTKSRNYMDGNMWTNSLQSAAVVATTIQAASTIAQELFYQANSALIAGLRYTAVLDSHTSDLCMSRSGIIYGISEAPYLPAHPRCRSRYVPVMRTWRSLGFNSGSYSGGSGSHVVSKRRLDSALKKDIEFWNGKPSGVNTFGEWLGRQSVSVQNEVLGETKATLFRKGGLENPLRKFYSEARNKSLTLGELKRMYSDSWKKAGL